MKYLLSTVAVTAVLLSGTALAADLAMMEPAEEAGTWTGLYIGGHAGWATGSAADSLECPVLEQYFQPGQTFGSINTFTEPFPLPIRSLCAMDPMDAEMWVDAFVSDGWGFATSQAGDTEGMFNYAESQDKLDSIEGWLAGAQIGYLYQLGQVVFGAEVNASLSSLQDDGEQYISLDGPDLPLIQTEALDINWTANAVGRLGFALDSNILLSADAGLALAGVSYSSMNPFTGEWKDEAVVAGWTAGVQGDVKLTDTLSLFASYNYSQFDDVAFDSAESNFMFYGTAGASEYDLTVQTIKTGFNYHFN
jgi:outer membrane immunogenic protein